MTLEEIAKALGGEVSRGAVLAPGPGHSRKDRSLSIKLSAGSPDGFLAHSFAGDDWRDCRDYVADRLGLARDRREARPRIEFRPTTPDRSDQDRIARAVAIWADGVDPRNTVVERYLASRGLDLPDDVACQAIRYHPNCPWRDEAKGETIRVHAMLGAMRSIETDRVTGVHRTRLTSEGIKVDRRMLGIAAGAAVKLDADDVVTTGITIGEGIETCLAGRQLGFRPAWALASAGAIASFPILGGIETLTILTEDDEASARATGECGGRWHAAGRAVILVRPRSGSDMNDAIRVAA